MPTQEKIDMVAALQERFSGASNIYLTDYAGLNVEQITKLRKELRENGIKFIVAKNTLLSLAAKGAGYEDMDQFFIGPTAVAFSDADPNVPAKILFDTYKEYKKLNKPEVKAFYVDNQFFPGVDIEKMAKLPSREILLSQVVAAVEGPIVNFVGTLDGIIRELVGTIDALVEKKSASE